MMCGCTARWDVPYKYDPAVTLGTATANEFGWRNHRVFVWVGVSALDMHHLYTCLLSRSQLQLSSTQQDNCSR